ncbi:MAG: NADPH:quinone reductase-like Zn-dependent oxidoreductase [Gammaproteobacteria bacterium]|jgi:NADPH:quinone reductase-like Zn-dependent oxidoreductase
MNDKTRYEIKVGTATMKAVVTTGVGGYEKLEYRDVPVPELVAGEVLIQVLAAGVNNTEINTRLGWYSDSVTTGTEQALDRESEADDIEDGGWNGATPFPFIQGTDCCGRVVKSAAPEFDHLMGCRVLVRACMRTHGFESFENHWMASDFDGAFAQYVKVPAAEVFAVDCDWSDVELATIPCAYGTAENMVHRARITARDRVLVAGASGGVGSAVVQLAKRRGAEVIAISSKSKFEQLRQLGVDQMLERGADLVDVLGERSVDAVFDNVAGDGFGALLKVLKPGGRYASSGAIGGPLVTLDMRHFYLKDLHLIGCTAWDEPVFPNLISYIEQGEIKPLVAKTFALQDIHEAQQLFLEKQHFGNFVLVPPAPGD